MTLYRGPSFRPTGGTVHFQCHCVIDKDSIERQSIHSLSCRIALAWRSESGLESFAGRKVICYVLSSPYSIFEFIKLYITVLKPVKRSLDSSRKLWRGTFSTKQRRAIGTSKEYCRELTSETHTCVKTRKAQDSTRSSSLMNGFYSINTDPHRDALPVRCN